MNDHATISISLNELQDAGLVIRPHMTIAGEWWATVSSGAQYGPYKSPVAALIGSIYSMQQDLVVERDAPLASATLTLSLEEAAHSGILIQQHQETPAHWYAMTSSGRGFGPADSSKEALLGVIRKVLGEHDAPDHELSS